MVVVASGYCLEVRGDCGKGGFAEAGVSKEYAYLAMSETDLSAATKGGGGTKRARKFVSPAARKQGEYLGHHRRWWLSSLGLGVSSFKGTVA